MQHRLPDEKMEVTLEDFANWLLQLPEEIRTKQIWYIDIGKMYKGKPVDFDFSPSKSHVALEELLDEEDQT